MYNESLKMSFINSFTNSINSATTYIRVFNRFESLENHLNKDIANMTEEEISDTLNSVSGLSETSAARVIIMLRAYITWCIENNVKNVSHALLSMQPNTSNRMIIKMYASPKALDEAMNKVFLPVKEQTVHNVYRCYMWLCYMGLSIHEIEVLEKNQVDFIRESVEFDMYGYKIYMEAIQTFESCVKQHSFLSIHPRYPDKPVVKDRANSKLLLSRSEKDVSVSELNSLISALKGADKLPHSHRNLYKSGVFYRMLCRERDGFNVDFSEDATKIMLADRSDIKGCEDRQKLNRAIKQCRRALEKDYYIWKNTFYGE